MPLANPSGSYLGPKAILTRKDVFDSIHEKHGEEPLEYKYWRAVEELYISVCDLKNSLIFYSHRKELFWGECAKMILSGPGTELECVTSFQKGASFLLEGLAGKEDLQVLHLMETLQWCKNHIYFPDAHVEEVCCVFEKGIHPTFDDIIIKK